MKPYVATTGTIFGLLVVLHVLRVIQERQLMRDPWFWLITVLAGVLCIWALLLLRRPTRP